MEKKQHVLKQSQGFFETRRLAHVNLYVNDLDQTMRFYSDVLGVEEVYRTPLSGGGFVSNGNTHHDVGFITADGPTGRSRGAKPGQLNHLGFELESEIALVESYQRAIEKGEQFLRTTDHDVTHSIYGADPDGNIYELYADVVHDWRTQRSGTVTKNKPNWAPGITPPVSEPMYHKAPELRRVESALFHPACTTGAVIVTENLSEMSRYYSDVVGLDVLSRGADSQIAVLAGTTGFRCLTLIEASASRPVGYHHVSMQVTNAADLDNSVQRAKSTGLVIVKDISLGGIRAVTLQDPDNFYIQFFNEQSDELQLDDIDADTALFLL